MRLYHGTTSRHLEAILKDGLLPRADRKSNWQAESCDEVVYLTKTYGLHFAATARQDKTEDLVIIEIDTDLLPDAEALFADEDALWFAWRAGLMREQDIEDWVYDEPMEKQAQYFAGFLENFAHEGFTWDWSLKTIGNCTYKGTIPPSAITRVVSYEAATGWWFAFHDPQVAPSNFKFCGPEYEATQLVVMDRLEEAKEVKMMLPMFMSLDAVNEMCRGHRRKLRDFEVDRRLAV